MNIKYAQLIYNEDPKTVDLTHYAKKVYERISTDIEYYAIKGDFKLIETIPNKDIQDIVVKLLEADGFTVKISNQTIKVIWGDRK